MKVATAGWSVGALALMLLPTVAHACAGCSNPNLPSPAGPSGPLASGRLQLGASVVATTMKVVHDEYCPDIGPICAVRNEPPQLHDQRFSTGELRLFGAYAFTERWSLELQVSFRVLSTDITFRRLDGTAFEPDYENIHHRDETLYGLGDPWLLARAALLLGPVSLQGRAGVGLPVGETRENPFALARAGKSHQHIQFGAGTVFPVVGVDASVPVGPVAVQARAQAVLYVAENTEGFQAGNVYSGGLGVEGRPLERLSVGGGPEVQVERPERWDGQLEEEGNLGRWELRLGARIGYDLGGTTLGASVSVPLYIHLTESSHRHAPEGADGEAGQLEYPLLVGLSVTTSLQTN